MSDGGRREEKGDSNSLQEAPSKAAKASPSMVDRLGIGVAPSFLKFRVELNARVLV